MHFECTSFRMMYSITCFLRHNCVVSSILSGSQITSQCLLSHLQSEPPLNHSMEGLRRSLCFPLISFNKAFIFRPAIFLFWMMPESTKLHTDIICYRMWHLMLYCVRLSALALEACAHGRTYSCIYLDKVFRMGVWDGSHLVRRELCLSQYADTYIFNPPPFRHRSLLHPKLLHGALLYLCIQCVRKTPGTWLPNGVLRSQAGVAAGLVYLPAPARIADRPLSIPGGRVKGQRSFRERGPTCSFILQKALSNQLR